MKKLILPLLASLLCGNCTSEEDASELTLFVTPSALTAGGGEMIRFGIEARTLHERITQFEIRSFDAVNGACLLFSEAPQAQSYVHQYIYQAPNAASDSLPIELTFRVTDNLASTQEQHIRIIVRNNTSLLPEKSGITLYSPYSGKPDGFSLVTSQPLLCATSAPEEIDLYLYTDPDAAPATCSREWRTMTDVRFAKANSFDYASATKTTLASYYTGSQRYNYVRELDDDDIILIGRESEVWGVIRIVKIFDEEGTANDRYLLNLKTL